MNNPLGYFSASPNDKVPTVKIYEAKSNKAFRRLSRIIHTYHKERQAFTVPLGRALTTDEAEQRKITRPKMQTYTEIPEGNELPKHPIYGVNNDLVKSSIPERQAAERIEVLNEIDIDHDLVDSMKASINTLALSTQDLLLEQCVAMFVAFDNASSVTEAVMRDGLGIPVEIDTGMAASLADISRLATASHFMEHTKSIPYSVRQNYLLELSTLLAANTAVELKKTTTGEKYTSLLRNLVARIRNKDGADVTDLTVNPMASMRTRSTGKTFSKAPSHDQ